MTHQLLVGTQSQSLTTGDVRIFDARKPHGVISAKPGVWAVFSCYIRFKRKSRDKRAICKHYGNASYQYRFNCMLLLMNNRLDKVSADAAKALSALSERTAVLSAELESLQERYGQLLAENVRLRASASAAVSAGYGTLKNGRILCAQSEYYNTPSPDGDSVVPLYPAATPPAPRAKPLPLTKAQLREAFWKIYKNDLGLLELSENNREYAIEAIGARHHWAAFEAGARATSQHYDVTSINDSRQA